ncbi:MAG: WYL domain-containing protein, partial [Gammaproteobacteria bacterium]|nr:WYL domain-containing protein [Gammaproteobacteria bacterium]
WTDKVRVVPRTQRLIQPKIDEDIVKVIYDALLNDRKFIGTYLKRGVRVSKEYPVSPLGLVFRDGVTYLVATLRDYPDVRQMALHRFRGAEPLDEKVTPPKGFKLDHYINDREFDYPEGDFINLEFKAKDFVIQALRETPLSHNQGIRPFEDDWVIVSCRIKETQQLRWWLLGFGAQVEVLQPRHLREWFKESAQNLYQMYQ